MTSQTLRRCTTAILLALGIMLAGCTSPFGGSDDAQQTSLSMTSGSSAALPFVAEQASGDDVRVVEADGLAVSTTGVQTVGNITSGWVHVTAPDDVTGERQIELEVGDDETETLRVDVHIEDATETAEPGQVVEIRLSYRTEDGLVFTNDPWVANATLPHDPNYQPPQDLEPLMLPLHEGQLPQALYEALLTTGILHNVTVEAEDAFGAASETQDLPRLQSIPREAEEPRTVDVPRQLAEQHGLVDANSSEGDRVDLPATDRPYVIDQLDDENVTFSADVEVGERYTLHEQWPQASEVIEVNDDVVVFRTTPPQEEGERFTWFDTWPDATEIVEVNDDEIVLRHTPEPGAPYESQGPQGQPVQAIVGSVQDDVIVITVPSQDPLAGRTILFDVRVLGIEDAPAQPAPGAPGQG